MTEITLFVMLVLLQPEVLGCIESIHIPVELAGLDLQPVVLLKVLDLSR